MNTTTPVLYNNEGFKLLNEFLNKTNYSKLFVLVDKNTKIFCLPLLDKYLKHPFDLIEIRNGESYKNLKTTQHIWEKLTTQGADRQSILINLGGGVVTDIGGFAAATFKRGIRFINIPTTVLGMVDAAIGGKTGVDFNGLKNQVGVFHNAIALLINTEFLKTLEQRELASGLAEIIKYGFIDNPKLFEEINKINPETIEIKSQIIKESATIKQKIVAQDPNEQNIRKTLNFGHTLGHAIETHFLSNPLEEQLLHGEAVAIGMIMALHLSYQTQKLSLNEVNKFSKLILRFYLKKKQNTHQNTSGLPQIDSTDIDFIRELLKHDKKNHNGQINFILLETIGEAKINCQVSNDEIIKAITFYNKTILEIY